MTPIFIGDEVTAAGYRLAGLRTHSPGADELPDVFHTACHETDLLLLTAEYARWLPAAELQQALRALSPLLLIVPDIRRRVPTRDLAIRIRTLLGTRL